MQYSSNDPYPATPKVPWNKGRIIGAKPPLQTKHVWSIRTMLRMGGKKRDLAMFNFAMDSKLPGCDIVRVKVRGRRSSRSDSRSSQRPPTQNRTSREIRIDGTDPRSS